MSSPSIAISIVSDVICPWCYIGLTQLQKAMAKFKTIHPDSTITLSWHAFELDPDLASLKSTASTPDVTPTVPRAPYYYAKFGGPELAAQRLGMLANRAAALGLKIDVLQGVLGPTKLVHEAMVYAAEKGKQTEFMKACFEATFSRGENIFGTPEIAKIADTIEGLSGFEVTQFLEQGKGRSIVANEIHENRGIGGVPHYTFNDRYQVSGGQDSETFLKVLEAASR
ncbi:thioredoxin-like protein [Lipomyces arxii]|uniref:thioredoxin-like protein n=1 Tax=Lipomyces arxii TaxID=56418 RepID=UPI0034CD12C2